MTATAKLDLFVGSRAIPMKYPVAASSGLFKNAGGGKFVFDTANAAVLHDIGLVSAAMFADVNGDGHPDLLLARDWGSIVLLAQRREGTFLARAGVVGIGAMDEPVERHRRRRSRWRRPARSSWRRAGDATPRRPPTARGRCISCRAPSALRAKRRCCWRARIRASKRSRRSTATRASASRCRVVRIDSARSPPMPTPTSTRCSGRRRAASRARAW